MAEITLEEQRAKLISYMKGFCAFHLLKTGVDLGLFEKFKIAEDGVSPETLSDQLGLHKPYVNIWCQTAYFMEILEFQGNDRFVLAPHMDTLLADTDNIYYFGHWVDFTATWMPEMLRKHPEYYKKGLSEFVYRNEDFSKSAKALGDQGVPAAYKYMVIPFVPGLKQQMDSGIRFLDIGCGSGMLMIELARSFPKCDFVGVDTDRFAIKHAQTKIDENRLQDKVSALFMDAASINYSRKFDIVNFSISLHEINPLIRNESLMNCHQALKDNGRIVILEHDFPNKMEDFRNPKYSYVILEQFFELTVGSKVLPGEELHQLLVESGFKDPITLSASGTLGITYARR